VKPAWTIRSFNEAVIVSARLFHINGEKIPVNSVIRLRAWFFAVSDVESIEILFLIPNIAGCHVGPAKPGEIIGTLPKFGRRKIRFVLVVWAVVTSFGDDR